MSIKPILFNTEMVRAILDGRKTCTRRVIKPQPDEKHTYPLGFVNDSTEIKDIGSFRFGMSEYGGLIQYAKPPYQPGDILYVRETWCKGLERYIYRADYSDTEKFYRDGKEIEMKWHPSIHMPKEAARIWLKVTDVRVERLQEITEEQACMEGTDPWDEACYENNGWHPTFSDPDSGGDPNMIDGFHKLWNSTIKKSDLDRYGWDASPWVWVIEFERCEKPEGV
nr:MAG TPA: ASCH domain protein [Caudoviricetes sp.]